MYGLPIAKIVRTMYNKTMERGNTPRDQERETHSPVTGKGRERTHAPLPPTQQQEVRTMSANELEKKVRELRQLQSLIEEAQAEAEAIKDQIKAHMGQAEELRAGEYKITWKPVTSSRLDSKALRAAAPELVERFTKTTTARRFCVA